jgi:hypothetical protein
MFFSTGHLIQFYLHRVYTNNSVDTMKLLATKHRISLLVTNNGTSAVCTDITCTVLQALKKGNITSRLHFLRLGFIKLNGIKNLHDNFLSMKKSSWDATMMAAI